MQLLWQINKKLLLLKIHYFFGFAAAGATYPFLSTISKQRGYSPVVFGLINLVLLIPGMFIRPAIGALTDRYRCRKSAIVSCAVIVSLLMFAMIFIPGSAVDKEMDDMYVIKSPLFWLFLCTTTLLSDTLIAKALLEDTICIGMLGENKHKYGHQRVWGSIGWGIITFISGFSVDWYSKGLRHKDYTPCFVISSVCSLLDVYVLTKIEVVQNSDVKTVVTIVGRLLFKIRVFFFLFWAMALGIFSKIISYYLFWYMEDLANIYHPETKPWIKTIQGLTSTIQCFGGEIPFFFLSGFILKRINHMTVLSLAFFAFVVQFCLYAVVENPVWILPIELLHGLTYALPYSSTVSFAAHIAPAGAEGTLQGIAGTVYLGLGKSVGTCIGGYFFKYFGSITSVKLLSIIASIFFITQIIVNQLVFRLSKNNDVVKETSVDDPKIDVHEDNTDNL